MGFVRRWTNRFHDSLISLVVGKKAVVLNTIVDVNNKDAVMGDNAMVSGRYKEHGMYIANNDILGPIGVRVKL